MRRAGCIRAASVLAAVLACTSEGAGPSTGEATAGSGEGPTSGAPATSDAPPGSTGGAPTSGPDPSGEGPTSGPDPDTGEAPGDGLGPAEFDADELDPPSHGGTITFQQIGAAGWYPSRRDPAIGPCDAYEADGCCLARQEVTGDALTPWDEDLILTLRGPLQLKQLAVYQPADAGAWALVSGWDARRPDERRGVAFTGNDVEARGFAGVVGSECLVDVATATPFACGDGSSPYCPPGDPAHLGWAGAKLLVLLARMPGAAEVGEACAEGDAGNWYDAPWVGLSLGELVRAGKFSGCHCYAKDPEAWYLGDGCGQFNVFEVVNDNNEYQNFGVLSTNFFGYAGYVGEGPCGAACDVTQLGPEVDLIDKGENVEAAQGAVATPDGGPGAAFRRPQAGYRYFLVLMDTDARTVQLAVVHPSQVPAALAPLLPGLPAELSPAAVADALALRLPQ